MFVAGYAYNAWGNLVSVTDANGNEITSKTNFAVINPIRYRGYYYDNETGFYYLQSRYYDPANCRFISADTRLDLNYGTTNLNLFAYCGNDPVNFRDRYGNSAEALQWWTSTMWWLCGVDGPIPAGDLVYGAGLLVLGAIALITIEETPTSSNIVPPIQFDEEENNPDPPDVPYPGDDPTIAPDGTEWKGNGEPGSKSGNYYNPNTKESFHPDLNHPDPIGPHWDYKDPHGNWWRLFKNKMPNMKIK